MSGRTHSLVGVLLVAVVLLLVQAMVVAGAPQARVVYVPAKSISNPSGAVVYQDYCAVCHGPAGRGDGPATRALETAIPDLTRMALRDGQFDSSHVMMHIRHVDMLESSPMPCWQNKLRMASGNRDAVQMVFMNLVRHLEALQVAK